MAKIYRCERCGNEAKADDMVTGNVECPKCGAVMFEQRGVGATLVQAQNLREQYTVTVLL